jgi:hypothetical protein
LIFYDGQRYSPTHISQCILKQGRRVIILTDQTDNSRSNKALYRLRQLKFCCQSSWPQRFFFSSTGPVSLVVLYLHCRYSASPSASPGHTDSTKLHQAEGPGPENIAAKLQETTANSFNHVVSSLHEPITTWPACIRVL